MIHFAFIYDEQSGKTLKFETDEKIILEKLGVFSDKVRAVGVEPVLIDLIMAPDDIFDHFVSSVTKSEKKRMGVIYRIKIDRRSVLLIADDLEDIKVFVQRAKALSLEKFSDTTFNDFIQKINSEMHTIRDKIKVAREIETSFTILESKTEFCIGEEITVLVKIYNSSEIPILITSISNPVNNFLPLISSNYAHTISGQSIIFDGGILLSQGDIKDIIIQLVAKREGEFEFYLKLKYRDLDDMMYPPKNIGCKRITIRRCNV